MQKTQQFLSYCFKCLFLLVMCCVSRVFCVLLVVSCPRLVSLLVNYVPAVFYYVSDHPVYLSYCLFS